MFQSYTEGFYSNTGVIYQSISIYQYQYKKQNHKKRLFREDELFIHTHQVKNVLLPLNVLRTVDFCIIPTLALLLISNCLYTNRLKIHIPAKYQ